MLLSILFLISSVLYLCQFIIYHKKGNSQKQGSLGFCVIFAFMAYAYTLHWEGAEFIFALLPLIGLVVGISQWRDSDFPKWATAVIIALHLAQLFLAAKEMMAD